METIPSYIFYFFVYSFLGWVCEDIYVGVGEGKFVNRGFFYGPYCPIYGVGALTVLIFLQKVQTNPILVFLGGIVLTSILEYFTSWIMEILFHERWWDYSEYPFNIHGRICLKNSLLFGLMALFLMYIVHPYVYDLFKFLYMQNHQVFFILYHLVLIIFIVDGIFTLRSLLYHNALIKNIHTLLQEIEKESERLLIIEKLEAFKQSHMSKAFPNRIHTWLKEQKDKVHFEELFKK